MKSVKIKLNTLSDIDVLLRIAHVCKVAPIAKQGKREADCSSTIGIYTLDHSNPFELMYDEDDESIITEGLSEYII